MRTLKRDKKPLYICKRIPDTEPVQFEAPVLVKLNTVASVSEAEIAAFGDEYKEYRRATIPIEDKSKFNEGDRAYIFAEPPMVHDILCETADFEINSVSDSVSQAKILFRRLQIGKG